MSNLAPYVPVTPQWLCNACGANSPAVVRACVDCGADRGSYVQKTVQMSSPIDSSGAQMVQNNVTNVQVEGGMFFTEAREEYLTDSEPEVSESPVRDTLHRVFMFTCTLALWIGMLTVVGVFLMLFAIVMHFVMFR